MHLNGENIYIINSPVRAAIKKFFSGVSWKQMLTICFVCDWTFFRHSQPKICSARLNYEKLVHPVLVFTLVRTVNWQDCLKRKFLSAFFQSWGEQKYHTYQSPSRAPTVSWVQNDYSLLLKKAVWDFKIQGNGKQLNKYFL